MTHPRLFQVDWQNPDNYGNETTHPMSVFERKKKSLTSITEPVVPPNITTPDTKSSGIGWDCFHEYTKNTSIHGIRYIGDVQLSKFERLFWVIMVLWAVAGALYYISDLFIRFRDMPVILTLSPIATPVFAIPFPSIVICNINNMRKKSALEIIRSDDIRGKKLVMEVCKLHAHDDNSNDEELWSHIGQFLTNVSQPCREMLRYCEWNGTPYRCSDLFNPISTDEGMCCVFNRVSLDLIYRYPREMMDGRRDTTLPSVDWNPEDGYPNSGNTTDKVIPLKPLGIGISNGLMVVADVDKESYYCSQQVLLHNPVEIPQIADLAPVIGAAQETSIVITPNMIEATPKLTSIDVSKRNCYFQKEKYLRFFRTYTEKNCIRECQANFTLTLCGCVLYHMPKTPSTKICGGGNQSVCANAAIQLMEDSLRLGYHDDTSSTRLPVCNCLAGCHSLDYSFTTSSAPLHNAMALNPKYLGGQTGAYFKENMGIMHFFYQKPMITSVQRGVVFGFTEFVSNTGGLLGLFMGFSILSGVEILYYFTIRLCSSWRAKTAPEKALPMHKKITTSTKIAGSSSTAKINHAPTVYSTFQYPFVH